MKQQPGAFNCVEFPNCILKIGTNRFIEKKLSENNYSKTVLIANAIKLIGEKSIFQHRKNIKTWKSDFENVDLKIYIKYLRQWLRSSILIYNQNL